VSFAAWLLAGAEEPARAAFVASSPTGPRIVSHAELRGRVHAAKALLARTVAPGDRVAVLSPNSPDAAVAILATIALGAVAVPLPASDPAPRLARMVAQTRPTAIFAEGRLAKTAAEIAPEAELLGSAEIDAALGGAAEPTLGGTDAVLEDDPALVLFTSGSTGEPRGVVLSHANLVANTSAILAALPIRARDRMMAILPFYYSFGASVLFTHVRAGACLVLNNQFMFADRVLEEMIREECTSFAGVPSTFQILLRRSSLAKGTLRFPHLRYVQQAGGRLSPPFVRELQERLPGAEIWLMYGQTEATARLSCLDPMRLIDKAHTIGKAIPGVTLEIVRPDGSLADPEEVGEVIARGPNVALGYWHEPEATAETFRPTPRGRSLFTGDLGKVDPEGFFVLVDRAKDFLKCAGYRVAMKEVEDVLVGFEGTVEAAVIGVPDELQGEAVKAFLVHPRGEQARADLDLFCKRALLPHLQPREVVFLEALPKTSSGKLARAELRRLA
jgi:acyl-CoA synthetase (AMP-forming)/AMP-acid ligase II